MTDICRRQIVDGVAVCADRCRLDMPEVVRFGAMLSFSFQLLPSFQVIGNHEQQLSSHALPESDEIDILS